MNHLFKRSLSLIVAVVMILSMIPANPVHVHAEDAATIADATVGFHVTAEKGLTRDYVSFGSYNKDAYALDQTDKVAIKLGANGYANFTITEGTRKALLADNNKVTVRKNRRLSVCIHNFILFAVITYYGMSRKKFLTVGK